GAGSGEDSQPQREQMPVGIGAHGQRNRHRMPLDVMLGRLLAREHRLYRAGQQVCSESRLRLDRELLLRTEGPTACAQGYLDVRWIEVQHLGNLLVVVHRSLALGVHLDAVSLWHDEAGFRLEKGNLDGLRLKGWLDHVRGLRERGVDVTSREGGDGLQDVG